MALVMTEMKELLLQLIFTIAVLLNSELGDTQGQALQVQVCG